MPIPRLMRCLGGAISADDARDKADIELGLKVCEDRDSESGWSLKKLTVPVFNVVPLSGYVSTVLKRHYFGFFILSFSRLLRQVLCESRQENHTNGKEVANLTSTEFHRLSVMQKVSHR